MTTFNELRQIDVGPHIEKKNGLSYLSWAWAVDQLLSRDPSATWEYRWIADQPFARIGETCMVFCTVQAFGVSRTAQLPVMDHRNKAIANPDSFAVNTAMQRCLAKAIGLHGIGLYIYAGEDIPETDKAPKATKAAPTAPAPGDVYKTGLKLVDSAKDAKALENLRLRVQDHGAHGRLTPDEVNTLEAKIDQRLETMAQPAA